VARPITTPRPAPEPGTADRTLTAGRIAVAVGLAVLAALLAGLLGGTLADGDAVVLVGELVTRAGLDVTATACVGLALIGVLLPPATPSVTAPPTRRADRALVVAAGAWVVLVVLAIVFRTASALARTVPSLTADELVAWSTRLSAGRGTLATAGCAAVVLALAVLRLRHPRFPPAPVSLAAASLAVALIGAALPALTGHSAAAPQDQLLGAVSIAVHVAAAALWVGGLGALLVLVAPHRDALAAALPRYSWLAGGCLLAVTATGVVNAVVRLDTWSALVDTGYGRLLVAKAVLLVALGGLGGLARRRLHTGRRPVLRWAGIEVAAMAVTIGVAATLSQTPPPATAATAAAHADHDTDHDTAPPSALVDLWAVRLDPLGTVVVDGGYRLLYRYDADTNQPSNSHCIDPTCLATWEPVLTDDRDALGHGLDQALVDTVVRPDGTRQVTLGGWPLYRRVGEAPGVSTSGATAPAPGWSAVAPDGGRATPA
jgi:putative copper resistance protein D